MPGLEIGTKDSHIRNQPNAKSVLNNWDMPYWIPSYVLPDNGPEFASKFFTAFCLSRGKEAHHYSLLAADEWAGWTFPLQHWHKISSLWTITQARMQCVGIVLDVSKRQPDALHEGSLTVQYDLAKETWSEEKFVRLTEATLDRRKAVQWQPKNWRLLGHVEVIDLGEGRRIAATWKKGNNDWHKRPLREPPMRRGDEVYIDVP